MLFSQCRLVIEKDEIDESGRVLPVIKKGRLADICSKLEFF